MTSDERTGGTPGAAAERDRPGAIDGAVREAATMMLYVAVVLIATLAAFPDNDIPADAGLLAVVWGTTIGLALAHVFAFRVVSRGLRAGALERDDLRETAAQIVGAALVALLCSIPVVFLGREYEYRGALLVPVALIAAAGYRASRAAGRSTGPSLAMGAVVAAVGLAVAAVKLSLGGH